jgi:uncharacterized membrane protein
MNKCIYKIIAIISLICLILAIIIYLEKTQYSLHHNNICSAITGTNGCEVVQTSSYGKILGIDNPIYGIVGFLVLGIFSLILIRKDNKILRSLIIAGGIIAGTMALVFLYIQAYILHTYCLFCVIVDILSLVVLGLTTYIIIKIIKHKHK